MAKSRKNYGCLHHVKASLSYVTLEAISVRQGLPTLTKEREAAHETRKRRELEKKCVEQTLRSVLGEVMRIESHLGS